tara:strand:- start:1478 stop:2419 length:942 start_codon:yes stop_codon:yes gene_type:complete
MSKDPTKDPLLSEAERWISDYDNQEGGALYDWNDETIKQFRDVPIETLLNDPYFLGLEGRLFDSVYNDVVDLWNDRKNRQVNLAIFLEAIGAGKSFKSSIILWLLWYEMCMHKNPQQAYGLADNSVICIMLLSRSEVQSRRVVFTYCWERFQSGFNKDYFPANPRFSREIRIDRNNTCIYAGTSSALSALGYNVYSAVIDEANFLEVTEDSKKSNEEMYDAGEEMYNAVMNRMTSRFMRQGVIPGVIVLISSPRYPDSFLERKIKEGKSVGIEKLNMFIRSRSLWKAKGSKYFDMSKYFEVDTDTLEILKEVK